MVSFEDMFELSGSVKEIFPEQTFGSGFNKREFVITTEDKYPQDIKFELVKEKTSMLDGVAKGSTVKVFFDIRGREWKGNYYVNLNAWKIEAGSGAGAAAGEDGPPLDHYDNVAVEDDDNIPF